MAGHTDADAETAAVRRHRWSSAAVPVAIAAALYVHGRALLTFFSADDLMHLQQAAGVLPTPLQPWRFLTQVVYFRAMLWLFGPWPLPFMAVNLALHALNVWLAHRLFVRRGVASGTAFLGGVLFAACPLLFVVLAHAVVINDISALTFSLITGVLLLQPRPRLRWLALPVFGVALFCKESVLCLPVLALAGSVRQEGSRESLGPRLALAAIVVAFAAGYSIARAHGAAPGGSAYETSFGAVMFHNLMTYTSWVLSLHRALPDLPRSVDVMAWRLGLPAIGVMIAVSIASRREAGAIRFGLLWWVAGLLPVLPLRYSAYPHYLYVALPGLALAIAATVAAATRVVSSRFRRDMATPEGDIAATPQADHSRPAATTERVTWVGIVTIALVYTLVSASHVSQRLELRMQNIDLPRDPQIRSFVVAGRAVYSLAHYDFAHVSRLAIVSAPEQLRVFGTRSGREYHLPATTQGYDLLRVVLNDGRALRVFFPALDSVAYVDHWSQNLGGFDLAIPGDAGTLVLLGRGPGAVAALADSYAAAEAPLTAAAVRESLRLTEPGAFADTAIPR